MSTGSSRSAASSFHGDGGTNATTNEIQLTVTGEGVNVITPGEGAGGGGDVEVGLKSTLEPPSRNRSSSAAPTVVGTPSVDGTGASAERPHVLYPHPSSSIPSLAKPRKSLPVTAYNTPKEALIGVVKAGMAKSILVWWQIVLLGFNAGLFLGMGNLAGAYIGGGFTGSTIARDASGGVAFVYPGSPALARFMHGIIFPIGLVLIVLAGSELLTGNIMYLTAAWLTGKCSTRSVLRNWSLTWVANLAGSCFCAYFLTYLPEIMHTSPQLDFLQSVSDKKMSAGWGATFLKAIGANWLVCLSLFCNLTAHDVVSKVVAIWMPIATFVWIGWEHSIANMYLIPLGLMEGLPSGRHFGDFLAWNLIPVTLGNVLGGAAFAWGQWMIYGEYAAPKVETLTTKHHLAKHQSYSQQKSQ